MSELPGHGKAVRFSNVLSLQECSDAPNWSRFGVFSCHACDVWRDKRQHKFSLTRASRELLSDRFQCVRRLQGKQLKINIVCRGAAEEDVKGSNSEEVANVCSSCITPSDVPPVHSAAKTTVVGRITRSKRYITPEVTEDSIPAENAAKRNVPFSSNAILNCVPATEVVRERSRRVLKPSSRLNDMVTEAKPSMNGHKRWIRSSEAVKRVSAAKTERKNRLLLDLLAEKASKAAQINEVLALRKECISDKVKMSEMSKVITEQKRHIDKSDAEMQDLKKKLKSCQSLVDYYKSGRNSNSTKKSSGCCAELEKALTRVLPGKHPVTKARYVVDEILSGRLLHGEALTLVNEYMHQYVRNLFQPWRLLKASDMSAIGAFRSSTVKALNEVIDHERIGLFPSASAVDRARAKLDGYALEQIGYERRMTRYGEVFYVNFDAALRLLLKACQLHDRATTESVKISLAIDGADLFKDRTHVSAGIKICDPNGIHPVTKQPLFVRNDNGEEKIVRMQSSEMCCILIIADARDKKELYEDVFREFYQWGSAIAAVGLPATETEPALQPFTVTHTTDLKASWYLSNRGGGCKNKNHFCTFCPCTRHMLVSYKVDSERCDRCKRRNRRKCYHHPVCDSVSVPLLLQCLQDQLGQYHEKHRKTFQVIRQKSKLRSDHMQLNKEQDIMHIDYDVPYYDPEKLQEYTQFISQECRIRSISLNGRLEDWRLALRECIALERSLAYLENLKVWHDQGVQTVPLVEVIEVLIPCILHCENRVGEKILTIILRRQLDRYRGPKEEFLCAMESCFQNEVLGSENSPSHWKLKYSRDNNSGQFQVDPFQLRNNIVRRMMDSIDIIVNAAMGEEDDEFKLRLLTALTCYKQAISLLTMHRYLNSDEKDSFQDLIDDFFEIWVELFGEEGITNYIHILGSGHMLYFIEKYDCLYMYSQQGWEDLNNRCQAFLMQSSSRGGYGSGEGKGKSYTFPIVRYILRDLLWKTGYADQFFNN